MPHLFVFYQYLYPDENVSSIHLSELCSGMVERGWKVTAYPSNRNIERPEIEYAREELWGGVTFRRIWRPKISRDSSLGRVVSAAWMVAAWSLLALKPGAAPDVLVVGTDPILSLLIAPVWRLLRPRTRIVHWCFDLYPEATYADGMLERGSLFSRMLEGMLRPSYRACHMVVDIGSCMRELVARYRPLGETSWKSSTLVPWALSEPRGVPESRGVEREKVFGRAELGLMYSGTFGRAHSFDDLLELMTCLEGKSIHLAFSVKGQRTAALRQAAAGRENVSFIPFAETQRLEERLASADIHVVSLREEWTGTVIPSKFFGALAAGRPVLFCGSGQSAVARWIREYQLGWVLEPGGALEIAEALGSAMSESAAMREMRQRCFYTYQQQFSKRTTQERWKQELSKLLEDRTAAESWLKQATR